MVPSYVGKNWVQFLPKSSGLSTLVSSARLKPNFLPLLTITLKREPRCCEEEVVERPPMLLACKCEADHGAA